MLPAIRRAYQRLTQCAPQQRAIAHVFDLWRSTFSSCSGLLVFRRGIGRAGDRHTGVSGRR